MKRVFSILLGLLMVLSSLYATGVKEDSAVLPKVEEKTLETVDEVVTKDQDLIHVYARVPSSWSYPCLWAWDEDGVSAFTSWPGDMMEEDPLNPGWYYIYVPSSMKSVIVNANDGTVQTKDYAIDGMNAWIVVGDDGDASVSKAQMTTGSVPEYAERFTLYAKVDESWQEPGLWAWEDPSGKNAFPSWPGKVMKPNANGWYSVKVPVWCNSIIVNANSGSVQTEDIKDLDPADMWITIAEDGSFDLTYSDPTIPKVEDVTVTVKVPSGWENPSVWAWSHPDGTNAFVSWPGEPLVETEDGLYTLEIPGWINSIIINADSGTVQTTDLRVDPGKDLFILVESADSASVSYDMP